MLAENLGPSTVSAPFATILTCRQRWYREVLQSPHQSLHETPATPRNIHAQ